MVSKGSYERGRGLRDHPAMTAFGRTPRFERENQNAARDKMVSSDLPRELHDSNKQSFTTV